MSVMERQVKKNKREKWKEVNTSIDFTKYKPISTSDSLHIYEEQYEIEGKRYRLLYAIGYSGEPIVEVLV